MFKLLGFDEETGEFITRPLTAEENAELAALIEATAPVA